MATSGTRTFTLNAADAIEEAYELAGLEYRTGYDGVTARRSMNIMFADWSNRGVQLWEVEQVSLDLVQGTTSYSLNEFDIDILDAVIRRTVNGTQTDFQIDRIERGEYLDIPNKNTQARVTQYYLERTITPKLFVWPAPENSTDKFVSYRWKRIQDISGSVDDVDLPSRFLPCLVTGLAFNLALKKNPDKAMLLQPLYEQNLVNAIRYDTSDAFQLVPKRTYV
tara:strand:+ start:1600 stop:2268 length:669 start_codon:yes stop_codon:yes gene_type:complete